MSEISISGRNRTVLVPRGTRLYAVGDIHGRKDCLDVMLTIIARDARSSRAARKLVVFLGDYIDRGPDSREVVETLQAGPPSSPEWDDFSWICLRGNHEDAMVQFLDNVAKGPIWLVNGALPTIESYLGDDRLGFIDLDELQAALRRSVPPHHLDFLTGLPISHVEGGYYFVHAGVRPGVALDAQNPTDQLWIRAPFLSSSADYGKVVVHGHTIVRAPDVRANRIGLDTGAFSTGRLTAMVAEGAERSFLST